MCWGLSSSAHSAGVNVSATTPEIVTAVATVTANCWYSLPASPPRNATGTNTDTRTSSMATIAPVTSRIDSIAASLGESFFSAISRSTFSSTTIASSTTIPVASTIANSVSVFKVKPKSMRPPNAPISDTGTAMIGISVARQLCRNTNTTSSTRNAASESVMITSWIDDCTKRVVSKGMSCVTPWGKLCDSLAMPARTESATLSALPPDCRKTAMPTVGLPSRLVNAS